MSYAFYPEWNSSEEDVVASRIYNEIILPKIKAIGLKPRWSRYENMPITGWMIENEDEMDFQHTLKQHPLERLKEMWHYMLEDLGMKGILNKDLPEPVKNKLEFELELELGLNLE